MPNSSNEDTLPANHVGDSEVRYGGQYSLNADELARILGSTLQWNALRLRFLTALQRALALPREGEKDPSSQGGVVGDLKGALTNVIIMQTRLNEREVDLVGLLKQARRDGLVKPVEVDGDDVRRWAESVTEAHHYLEQRASEPEE